MSDGPTFEAFEQSYLGGAPQVLGGLVEVA